MSERSAPASRPSAVDADPRGLVFDARLVAFHGHTLAPPNLTVNG